MKKLIWGSAVALVLTLTLYLPVSTLAQGTSVHEKGIMQGYSYPLFVPCANHGDGEIIVIGGDVSWQCTYTLDANGTLHMECLYGPRGTGTGVGMTSGTVYDSTGMSRINQQVTNVELPYEFSMVNVSPFIARGSEENLLFRQLMHWTIDANGHIHAAIDKITFVCH